MRRRHAEDPEARAKQLEGVRKNDARYRVQKQAWIDEYLQTHPCVDCGETDRDVLDFDHVTGTKSAHLSDLLRGRFTLAASQAEVEKCVVRCANDHRRITRRRERGLDAPATRPR